MAANQSTSDRLRLRVRRGSRPTRRRLFEDRRRRPRGLGRQGRAPGPQAGNVLHLDGRWCLADFGTSRYAEACARHLSGVHVTAVGPVATAGLTFTPAVPAQARPSATQGSNDISFPRCGRTYPSGQTFAIVGVNGGKASNFKPVQLGMGLGPDLHGRHTPGTGSAARQHR